MSDRGNIRIITRQSLANIAAKRWYDRYSNYCGSGWFDASKRKIYEALESLGPAPLPSAVNKAIGNDSWTIPNCDVCDRIPTKVVAFEGMSSDEYGESELCSECISDMQKALDA